MLQIKVVKNYSAALFKSSINLGIQDKVFQQLEDISFVISSNDALRDVLYSPVVKATDKIRLIGIIANKLKIEQILREFLLLIIEHDRMNMFNETILKYKNFLNKSKNIKDVKVTASKVLSDSEKEEIKIYLEKDFGQKINIEFNYNTRIIGGITLQYDSKLVDYSIAGLLNNLANSAEVVLALK